ncbi:alpha/beta hydrolase family protein [Bradyrhizobium guangdongense]|uniref:Hydrolase n=1 Tax=Bradyrhizobium guangdongense TaxID=1325090 RepID=A0A410V6B9_9BRAD|nr:alpha/beta hydrolase [Bradyrhizobium guangdongense]QAU39251.1 hydrolase [Bradyrhizobium guangdongense]QOZ60308.1 hydrolase [Bradyrhizobium guangdongense]GGI27134.1 dienelactone hydrolase [Bradyrhizobium guangdongense]
MRKAFWSAIAVLFCLASPVNAAGIQLINYGPNLTGAIWYPCEGKPKDVELGELGVGVDYGLVGVKDCPVTGTKLPLVIVSHGYVGWFGGHHDTAAALADAGFVVAAINHPGDNANDSSRKDDLSSFLSRPTDMVRLLDFVLQEWKDGAVIDPAKIGLFGFSKGGYTGLALIGAAPDFGRYARGCTDASKLCEQLRSGDIPAVAQDARIRAAVIADPIPGFFTQSNLAAIRIPVQFWRAEIGIGIIDPEGTARVARALPGKPEVHSVPAGHFAFVAPCSPELKAVLPRICTDKPAEFDRLAFHREFNGSVARFFHEHLTEGN